MTRVLAIACAALALAAAGLLLAWRHDHGKLVAARAVAEGRAEAERVTKAGVIAAAEAARGDADRQRHALEEESVTFRAEAARQLAAAKGRIETLLRLQTGVLVAGGVPRPPTSPQDAPGSPAPSTACPPCLLAPGDHGEVLARISTVRYEHGTLSVAGDAEARRIDPDGPHPILVGAWSASKSTAIEVPREVVTQRARFTLRGGVVDPWAPAGGYGGAGLRVLGALWVEVAGQVAHGQGQGTAGVAWEIR